MQDFYLYNAAIARGLDLDFIKIVDEVKTSKECILLLVTSGGDPDAAFKISRYLQDKYEKFSVLVSGLCKSAGTLVCIGAHEIIFTPYGELGPLDIQISKEDKISGQESGLNISEALITLEENARVTFNKLIGDIIQSSNGIISFPTASKSATDFLSALYAPIFSRIDPEEVGNRARAMRIGTDYGRRLDARSNNLNPNARALEILADTYSSHGFVIDQAEASELFVNVRAANKSEMKLVEKLGDAARIPRSRDSYEVTKIEFDDQNGNPHHEQDQSLGEDGEQDVGKTKRNQKNSREPGAATNSETSTVA